MTIEEVKSRLCNYDTRNPQGVSSYLDKEEIEEEGYKAEPQPNCGCDNCFYGRTKMAMYILTLIE